MKRSCYLCITKERRLNMEKKTKNRVGTPISVVGRGVRSYIRWHSPEDERRLLEQARKAYAEFQSEFAQA